jgi:hypothetical protein
VTSLGRLVYSEAEASSAGTTKTNSSNHKRKVRFEAVCLTRTRILVSEFHRSVYREGGGMDDGETGNFFCPYQTSK